MGMMRSHGHSTAYESHWPCIDCALADLDIDADATDDEIAEKIFTAGTVGLSTDASDSDVSDLADAISKKTGIPVSVVRQSIPSWDEANHAWSV